MSGIQKVFYVWKNSQNKQKVRLFLQKCVFLGQMVEILFFLLTSINLLRQVNALYLEK